MCVHCALLWCWWNKGSIQIRSTASFFIFIWSATVLFCIVLKFIRCIVSPLNKKLIENAYHYGYFECSIDSTFRLSDTWTFYWKETHTKNTEKKHNRAVFCRAMFLRRTHRNVGNSAKTLYFDDFCVCLCVCDFHSERISIINLCVWIRMEVNWWLYCHSYAWWKCNLIRWQSFGLNETQHSNAHSSVRGIPFELSTLLACIRSACHCNVFNV